jgi:hypothetical protein
MCGVDRVRRPGLGPQRVAVGEQGEFRTSDDLQSWLSPAATNLRAGHFARY